MSLQIETLEALQQSQELVEVYRDGIHADSLQGVITAYTDDFIYMSLVSEAGLDNGIAVIFAEHITRIRWQGNVRACVSELMQRSGCVLLKPALNLSTIQTVLQSVQYCFGYVNIHSEKTADDICFIGEIEKMDTQTIVLHGYGTMVSRDRNRMMLSLDEITRVDAEAQYEKDIKALMSVRK
jgi:hypothetical protein